MNGVVYFFMGSDGNYGNISTEIFEGAEVRKGQRICYVEYSRSYLEIKSKKDGKVKKLLCKQGDFIVKGSPIIEIE